MKVRKSSILLAILIIIASLALDQTTKWAVVQAIPLYGKIELIPHFFDLTYIQNIGAGFSIMEGYGVVFFSLITLIACAIIVYYFCTTEDRRIQSALSFVFAGALGNWIDRLRFGYVRDFFSFRIFGQSFPVFNVADVCITMGFFSILLILWIDDFKEKRKWKQNKLQ